MSYPITKESLEEQLYQLEELHHKLKKHHKEEIKWMKELIVKLELELEAAERTLEPYHDDEKPYILGGG